MALLARQGMRPLAPRATAPRLAVTGPARLRLAGTLTAAAYDGPSTSARPLADLAVQSHALSHSPAQRHEEEDYADAAAAAAGSSAAAVGDGGYADGGEGEEGLQQQEAQQQEELTEVLVTEEEEIEVQPVTFQSVVASSREYMTTTNIGRGLSIAAGLLMLATLAIAVQRAWQKTNTPKAKRARQIQRNKELVQELSKFLPDQRSQLTSAVVKGVKSRTGFTTTEVFRKYLWYLLRERKFDQTAVDDLVALKGAAGLTDVDVAEALKERAQRIYDQYGTLMLNTEGMTAGGIERKATCQNLFRKILYLTEWPALLQQGSEAAATADLRNIFGATEQDLDNLRIVSLHDVDLERVFAAQVPDLDTDTDDSATPPQVDTDAEDSSGGKKYKKGKH